ncbi:hypothetical protein [Streptomyces sp. NBC_01618]|uniref:hypothetical protein n=1 Tax=Streptomyces sp. NBC_01618 TaxID=2975900 RepID=UPI003870CBCA
MATVTFALAIGYGGSWLLFFPLLSLACGTVLRHRQLAAELLSLAVVATLAAVWRGNGGPSGDPRVGLQRLDSRFAAYRDALGLDPALEFHSLRLGDPPSPLPGPVASLVRAYLAEQPRLARASSRSTAWLFPGRQPGHPMDPTSLGGTWSRYAPGDHSQ